MRHCRIFLAVQVVFVIASLASGGLAHGEVALGASLGYTHLSYPDLSDFTNDVIGMPGAQEWGQPGLRVGYVAQNRRWDLNVDFGLLHRSGTLGRDEAQIEFLPQVQANASGHSGLSPFVNAGVGIVYETVGFGSRSVTATRPVFGGGIGLRRSVSEGHGLVRVELRYDHVNEHVKELSPFETFTFPSTDMFSVKLGFDLLVGR